MREFFMPSKEVMPPIEQQLEHFAWLLSREPAVDDLALELTRSQSPPAVTDDNTLVRRIMASYRHAIGEFEPSHSEWDRQFCDLKRELHDAFMSDDPTSATALLRDPASNAHFWGFDAISKSPPGKIEPHELVIKRLNRVVSWTRLYGLWIFDAVKNLAEAVGAKCVAYPEVDVAIQPIEARVSLEETLAAIEAAIGLKLNFPNPYSGELGLASSRGIIGFRSVQALYQAWRIRELSRGAPGFKVLEIGAGLGRTAYYAASMGLSDYTIIDIPMTNAAQGYFLGRTVGEDALRLYGEPSAGRLRVLPPTSRALSERYDLVVNVDSLPEMDPIVAKGYWAFVRQNARAFLSINHEYNPWTVRALYSGDPSVVATRHPYWMRRGYVEELVRFTLDER